MGPPGLPLALPHHAQRGRPRRTSDRGGRAPLSPAERYAAVVKAFVGKRGVSAESGRGFGSSALKIDNRIFAMLASGDQFVVKLPRQRVDALVAAGEGERFDPRRNGKLMKEWLVVAHGLENRWLPLAQEAFEFAQVEKSKRA